MRATVNLDEKTLKELLRATGCKKNNLAVSFAVHAFLNRKKARAFGRMMREGEFDYQVANG